MTLASFITACGGRRFFMAMGSGIVNTGLLVLGYISPEVYQTLILGTVAVYIGASTVEKRSKKNDPDQS